MKDANFRKSLSCGFILSMVLLSLRLLGNPLRSTCNKSMHPVEFRESEFMFSYCIVRKYRVKNTLLSIKVLSAMYQQRTVVF